MEKTDKKARKISEIIAEMEGWKKEHGDMEVMIANTDEACFDGVGKMFVVMSAENHEKFLGILRSEVVIKPR